MTETGLNTLLLRELRAFVAALCHHWVALIVGPAFTLALSIIPAMQGKTVPSWLWALAVPLAILPASFLAWRSEWRRLKELESQSAARENLVPRVSVRPDGRFLVVRNDGETAKFWAHFRVVDRRNFSKTFREDGYDGCWDTSGATEEIIPHGFERRLWFGGVRGYSSNANPVRALVLYYFNPAVGGGRDEKEGEYLAVATPPQPEPWLRIEVTLTSEPAMREQWVRRYDLTTEGTVESKSQD